MSTIIPCEGVVLMNHEEAMAMPCSPDKLNVQEWSLCALPHNKHSEAAARILVHSIHLSVWVGVTWTKLTKIMGQDIADVKKPQEKTATTPASLLLAGEGLSTVLTGFHNLISNGYLRIIPYDDDDEILFHTPALVTRVLELQQRQAATA